MNAEGRDSEGSKTKSGINDDNVDDAENNFEDDYPTRILTLCVDNRGNGEEREQMNTGTLREQLENRHIEQTTQELKTNEKQELKFKGGESEPRILFAPNSEVFSGDPDMASLNLDLIEDGFDKRVFLPEIPPEVANWLDLCLEDRKEGGGDVEKLEFYAHRRQALVTFADPGVARRFVNRGFVQIKEQKVRITEMARATSVVDEETEDLNTIVVAPVGEEVDIYFLEKYFNNRKRSSGGGVKKIQQISGTSSVLVTFEDPQAADEVLKRSHLLNGIALFVDRPGMASLRKEGSQAANTADNTVYRSTSIRVAELGDGIGEDLLKLFFENKKKSGGGAVRSCQASGDGCTVTFEDSNVVESVMRRHLEKPLQLLNSVLEISVIPPITAAMVLLPGMEASWVMDYGCMSCAIKISGLRIDEALSIELIQMFFDSRKRSGGGGIVEVVPKEDENVAVVVFESPEVVGRVLQQYGAVPFILNNSRLSLEILRPLPVPALPPGDLCPRSLLCRGIYSGTTSFEIKRYFSERLNYAVDRLTFSLKPDIVLVQFRIEVDYCNVTKVARSFPLGPVMIYLERVPVLKSVQVYNYGNLSAEALELYLENPRGLNANVSSIEERKEDGCMIVHFENDSVIPRLLENPQAIEGLRLHFNVHHECLGLIPPDVNSSEPICLLPPNIQLNFHPDIIEYIAKNKVELDEIQKHLAAEYCSVEFTQQMGDGKVTLVCQLKNNLPDLSKLTKCWAQRCTKTIQTYISGYTSRQMGVLQDFWEMLKEKLRAEIKPGIGTCLDITIEDTSHSISFVGRTNICEELERKIKAFLIEIEEYMETQKRTVTEKIDCLKMHQLRLLNSIKFFDEDTSCASDCIRITYDGISPIFAGQSSDVMAKKIKMFEILNKIESVSYSPPEHAVRMLNEKKFVEHLQESLEKQSLRVVWDLGSNVVSVYGLTQEDVDEGINIIKDEFIFCEIPLDKQAKNALIHPVWLERKTEFKNYSTVIIEEDKEVLRVFATSDIIGTVIRQITDFLEDYTNRCKIIPFKSGVCRILSDYKQSEIEAICKKFSSCFVEILPTDEGFEIQGTNHGLTAVENELEELSWNVIIQERVIDSPGMALHFLSKKGKDYLEIIQGKHAVYIEKSGDTSKNFYNEGENRKLEMMTENSGSLIFAQVVLDNAVTVSIVAGDITTCKVDVIVAASDKYLYHDGGVSYSIVVAGGYEIQEECTDYIKKSGRVNPGSLFVSKPGRLPCKAVFHVVGPIWQGGRNNEENTLYQAVTSALEEMVKLNYSSVAMPAISSGIYGFPLNKACKIFLEAIRDFVEKDGGHSNLSEINIVDISGEVVDMFSREMKKLFGDRVMQPVSSSDATVEAAICRNSEGAVGGRSGRSVWTKTFRNYVGRVIPQSLGRSGRRDADAQEMLSSEKFFTGITGNRSMKFHNLPANMDCSFETKVSFRFFSLRYENIEAAVKELEKYCNALVIDKVIQRDYSEVIAKLTTNQIAVIKNMEALYPVSITIDQGRVNRIRIRGEMEYLITVHEELYKIFREIEKSERDIEKRKFAEIVAKQVQWMYEDGSSLTAYPMETNVLIEKAYHKKENSVEWGETDEKFRIDFKQKRVFKEGMAGGGIIVKRVCSNDSKLPGTR